MQNRQFTITMLAILISNVNICLGTEVNLNPDSCKVTGDSMEFCSRIDNPFLQLDFNSNTKAGLFDFIEDAWNVITSPLKPVWGYYEEIAQLSPVAVRLAKESVLKAFETGLQEGLYFERKNFYMCFASEDQKEGMNAFVEKRKPDFKGR